MEKRQTHELKTFLDKKVHQYNNISFIENDPICIPHAYKLKQDIEIAAFFAAIFAWGKRTIIINKCKELMQLMDNVPYDFIMHHKETDLSKLMHFKHRTFNTTDLLYFIAFLRAHYTTSSTLETAFVVPGNDSTLTTKEALVYFHHYFFSLPFAPLRTKKHIATPLNNSTCKRLNMFLRWMVRKDNNGVDFGLWKSLQPSQLLIPIDIHVSKVAARLGLLHRKQIDFNACLQLTKVLRTFDKNDPIQYDFALFGLGALENYY